MMFELLERLVEEGKLTWADPVRKHLPYFQLYNPYVSQEMRIRDLLSHRSGLGTYSGDLLWYGTRYSAEEVVRRPDMSRKPEPSGPRTATPTSCSSRQGKCCGPQAACRGPNSWRAESSDPWVWTGP